MIVFKTYAMECLLQALHLNYEVFENHLKITDTKIILTQSVLNSEADIQRIYANTMEWKEILKHI